MAEFIQYLIFLLLLLSSVAVFTWRISPGKYLLFSSLVILLIMEFITKYMSEPLFLHFQEIMIPLLIFDTPHFASLILLFLYSLVNSSPPLRRSFGWNRSGRVVALFCIALLVLRSLLFFYLVHSPSINGIFGLAMPPLVLLLFSCFFVAKWKAKGKVLFLGYVLLQLVINVLDIIIIFIWTDFYSKQNIDLSLLREIIFRSLYTGRYILISVYCVSKSRHLESIKLLFKKLLRPSRHE